MPDPLQKRPWNRRWRCLPAYAAVALSCLALLGPARAGDASNESTASNASNRPLAIQMPQGLAAGPEGWTSPEGLSSAIQVMLLLTVLSLAPAVLLMTTCFVRIIVVLSLLRQAVGTQQLPPSQVITSLALFLTFLIMSPVWKQVYDQAIVPYTQHQINLEQAWKNGAAPIRRFMSMQIERTNNREDVWLFLNYVPGPARREQLRRRSFASPVAGLHAERVEDRLPHRFPDLLAVPHPRHGDCQRDGVDGNDDAAAGVDFAAVQNPVVRAGRWLAFGGANVDGEFSTVYVRTDRQWTRKAPWSLPVTPFAPAW